MKIAILSDTHNQVDRTRRALALARQKGAELYLHCGDIEDPPVVSLFTGLPAHFVLGNCDWDQEGLRTAIAGIGATLHDGFGHVVVDGKNLAFLHGHVSETFDSVLNSGAYDYLFHGHTHVARNVLRGTTRVINPGALQRATSKTFVVLDVATGVVESVEVV